MVSGSVRLLISACCAPVVTTTVTESHEVAIESATVTASVLEEISVADTVGVRRVPAIMPRECLGTRFGPDQGMVLNSPATANVPIRIVHFVDLQRTIGSPNANGWHGMISVIDVENGGTQAVEIGDDLEGTLHRGLGPAPSPDTERPGDFTG